MMFGGWALLRLLKIFKNKPLTRVELKSHSKGSKFRLRASRTSGVNAAVHPLRGLTFNTKHGLRASKTFKGLTLGFQRGNSVVRGRWSSSNGLLNLNLSKSGFSLSSKSKYGTYNFSNPNRSSFKLGGIQLRGKNAKGLAFIATVFTLIPVLIKTIFMLPVIAFRLLVGIFYILELLAKLSINFFIILWRLVLLVYDVSLLVFIDIPKQIVNNISSKKVFDTSYKAEEIIDRSELADADQEQVKNLKIRLASYSIKYDDISTLQKCFSVILASVGFLLISTGALLILIPFMPDANNTFWSISSIILFSAILIIVGRLAIKPFFKMRQQKEDEEFREILGI